LALGALVLSGLVLGLDITILVTALPTLSAELGATTDQLQWISAAYTLSLAGFLLPAGVLADRYGRRRLLFVGLLMFGVSSVVASQVTSANALIAMRAVMGVGGAIIMPVTLAILPTIFSALERPRAIAITAATTFLGLPLGPLLAGWLLVHYSWGVIFLINAPVVVLALLGAWFFIPESRDPRSPRLDWVGALLSIAGVTAVVYGIIEQPLRGWASARVLLGLLGGVAILALFIVYELRTRRPLIDLRLFRDPLFGWATAVFTVVGFGMTGALFLLTPFLQVVQGNDAQATGIRLLPLIGGVLVSAIASARLARRLGYNVAIAAGLLVTAGGFVVFSRVGAESGYGLVAVALAVIGVGIGMTMPPSLDAILAALPASQMGAGNALTRTLQNIAASFGAAIMGSILNSAYRSSLEPHLTGLPSRGRDVAEGSVAGAAAVARHLPPPVGRPLLRAAFDAYTSGMSEVWLICAGLVVVMAVLAARFMPARGPVAEGEDAAPPSEPAADLAVPVTPR
jgi:EmrB/QacA subfamily drug resistance transporter